MKVVLNRGYGRFRLSQLALRRLYERKVKKVVPRGKEQLGIERFDPDEWRTHPDVIEVVEELGRRAGEKGALLIVVTIPDDLKYYIHELYNVETIHEVHRSWPSS